MTVSMHYMDNVVQDTTHAWPREVAKLTAWRLQVRMVVGSCGADDRTHEHGGQEAHMERPSPQRDEPVFDAKKTKIVGDQGNQGNDAKDAYGGRRLSSISQTRS